MELKAAIKKAMPKSSEKITSIIRSPKAQKAFRILNTVKNVFCWSLLAILVFTVIIFMSSRIKGESPAIFGYSVYRVSSGSMEPEIMTGDVILSKAVDDIWSLEKGDVITFDGSGQLEGSTVTHKIIKSPYTDENGRIMLQTKGVANDTEDAPISSDRVRSKYVCKIPVLDLLYNLFLSMWGFIIFIALLMLIFFDEVINIIKIVTGKDAPNEQKESINEIIERIKLEEQQKQLEQNNNDKKRNDKTSDEHIKSSKKHKQKPTNLNNKQNKSLHNSEKKDKASKTKTKNHTQNYPHKKKKKKGKRR